MGFKFGDEILRVSGVEREKKEGFFIVYIHAQTQITLTPLYLKCYVITWIPKFTYPYLFNLPIHNHIIIHIVLQPKHL